MLIANIFQYPRSFYDLPSSRYKNNPVIQAKKQFFVNILKTKHLRPYIAS